jgi:hypothetical protein
MSAELPTAPIALVVAGRFGAASPRPRTVIAPHRVRPSRVRLDRIQFSRVRLSRVRLNRVRLSRARIDWARPGRVRPSRTTRVIADIGSLVTLSALALLGVAAAAGLIGVTPAAEGPTYSVTFADR